MIHDTCGTDTLGDVASPVVYLEEKTPAIFAAGRQPPVPDVRNEQSYVTRLGDDRDDTLAVAGQVDIPIAIARGWLTGFVTARDDPRRAACQRTIYQENVCADGKYRIGDSLVPFARCLRMSSANSTAVA